MAKRIDTKSLVAKIEQITREKMRDQHVVSLKDYRDLSKKADPKTVLLVEDDETVRRSIQKLLEKEGMKVLTATDGTDLSIVLDGNPLDLIILDVGLPWINGFELAQLMKEHKDLKRIPMIFVSGQVSDADVKKGFEVGADDYIKKPFDIEEFRRSVTTLLKINAKN